MTRRTLVTGASGFIGQALVARLLADGDEVHTISRAAHAGPGPVIHHRADLLDPAETQAAIRAARATHLVHLAWDVTPGRYWTSLNNLDWVAASLHLYRAFAESGGERALGVGTCAEYDWSAPLLDERGTPCRPATLYGSAKHALHQVLAAVPPPPTMAWARLFFLYGPHEAPGRLVSGVATDLLQGRPALCGDGTAERDFMHVDDAARALALVLSSSHRGPVNIASGDCVPVREVIVRLGELCGRPDLVRLGARAGSAGEPPRLEAGMAVLRDTLGFAPAFGLEAGLRSTVEWWRGSLA